MSDNRLQTARELIQAKRYDEARAILEKLSDPTAKKWLARLNEVSPQKLYATQSSEFDEPPDEIPHQYSMNSPGKTNRFSGTLVLLFVIVFLTLGLAIYGAFIRPVGVSAAELQVTPDTPPQNVAPVMHWEYLVLQYSQSVNFDEGAKNPLEFVIVDRPDYAKQFDNGCQLSDYSCIGKSFKGMSYYISVLGIDGWELVTVNNTSTSSYSIEMFFKRSIQTTTPNA